MTLRCQKEVKKHVSALKRVINPEHREPISSTPLYKCVCLLQVFEGLCFCMCQLQEHISWSHLPLVAMAVQAELTR